MQHTTPHLQSILVLEEERLQHAAANCSTLQNTATYYNTPAVHPRSRGEAKLPLAYTTHCNTLQHTCGPSSFQRRRDCNTLQHTATHYNTPAVHPRSRGEVKLPLACAKYKSAGV